MVSSFLYGEIPMKCKSCIWANKVNRQVTLCPFPKCVKLSGWIADAKNNQTTNQSDKQTI